MMLLTAVGEALYGERWQSDLARDLGVADRTIRRWVSDGGAVPPGVARDLQRLVMERAEALDKRAEALDKLADPLKRAAAP